MADKPTALHEDSLSLKELDQQGELPKVVGELPRVVDVTADGGGHAVKSPAPMIQVRSHSLTMATGGGD